ncbi:hypothetical protein Q8A73_010373 [Channa argus]|nr:hypothetical protein Q8A73_010373 [Channa argus]
MGVRDYKIKTQNKNRKQGWEKQGELVEETGSQREGVSEVQRLMREQKRAEKERQRGKVQELREVKERKLNQDRGGGEDDRRSIQTWRSGRRWVSVSSLGVTEVLLPGCSWHTSQPERSHTPGRHQEPMDGKELYKMMVKAIDQKQLSNRSDPGQSGDSSSLIALVSVDSRALWLIGHYQGLSLARQLINVGGDDTEPAHLTLWRLANVARRCCAWRGRLRGGTLQPSAHAPKLANLLPVPVPETNTESEPESEPVHVQVDAACGLERPAQVDVATSVPVPKQDTMFQSQPQDALLMWSLFLSLGWLSVPVGRASALFIPVPVPTLTYILAFPELTIALPAPGPTGIPSALKTTQRSTDNSPAASPKKFAVLLSCLLLLPRGSAFSASLSYERALP